MSDFDTPPSDRAPETPPQAPVAFCQNCGKPLSKETVRIVGPAVYCEPCLAARLAGDPSNGYAPVNPGTPGPGPSGAPFGGGWSAIPRPPATPNPGLAAALGLIPGVGAMYNEQYAKGIVHLLIFAVLVTLAHATGIFGLFIAGWIIYMAMEAHHTAKARRDGTPLPNPFGLNDIGERMGFGPDWNVAGAATVARDAAHAAGFHPSTPQPPYAASDPPPASPAWGQPAAAYTQPYPTYANPADPGSPPYGAPIPPYAPTYGAAYPPPPGTFSQPSVPSTPSRFPAGAVWLIGLGTLFLLGTEGLFSGFRGETLVGLVILAFGAWVFFRRITEAGPVENDGSAQYQFRLLYALRPSVWLLLLGALFLFDSLNILRWDHSWPFFIIIAGVMMLLNRAPFATPAPFPPQPSSPAPTQDDSDTPTGGR